MKPKTIPTSIRLTEEEHEALAYLKSLPGGFNLNGEVRRIIIREAKKMGWKK